MRFSRITLKNWKNFKSADIPLLNRAFIVGPNASGKSNLLDAFRFLHDLVAEGGGLKRAVVDERGGILRLRSLHARKAPKVVIDVEVQNGQDRWSYSLGFGPQRTPDDRPVVLHEIVYRNREKVLDRPNDSDKEDPERLFQTALQQTSANKEFRVLSEFFRSIEYMSLVPQLIREGQSSPGTAPGSDPLGRDFMDRIASTPPQERGRRLKLITAVLKKVVPQFKTIEFIQDKNGRPHLEAGFQHWRQPLAKQRESQFSDGTLRLLAMLWQFQSPSGPILLDEPEWSLHTKILRRLAGFLSQISDEKRPRQVIVATHSEALLSDEGIGRDEVVLILPDGNEGSTAIVGGKHSRVRKLMESGLSASEAALPITGRDVQLDLNYSKRAS